MPTLRTFRNSLTDSAAPDMTNGAGAAKAMLASVGWSFTPFAPTGTTLPRVLANASDLLQIWVSSFSELATPDDAVWFLSRADFDAQPGEGFGWNALEQISLEAADTDQETAAVTEFWSAHCPILLSVRGHYSYLAERTDGAIVHGEEPDFEATTVVAPDFEAFLDSLGRRATTDNDLVEQLLFGAATAST